MASGTELWYECNKREMFILYLLQYVLYKTNGKFSGSIVFYGRRAYVLI